MYSDLFIFIIFYFLAIFSTVGYGLIFEKLIGIKNQLNLGFVGLGGVLFLIIYSLISHNFISHNIIHNTIINLIGLASFLLLYRSRKKEFFILIAVFIVLIISFFLFKTHDDFPYYHFPYTLYLTENSSIFGVGLLNHGFKTPSSIFYFNSLFFLPYIKYYLFQIGAILIFGFSILVLLYDIKKKIKIKEIDFDFFLRLFSLCFILIFFYRIQEHGTDRSGQILILLFIAELINIRKNYFFFNISISKLIILLTLIIGLKLFFLLYLIFVLPFIFYLFRDKKLFLFIDIFRNKLFYFSFLSFIIYIFTYFINTGCFLFPVSLTCLENFSWSLNIEDVKKLRLHYENWSKAGSGAGYQNIDKINYVKDLNWLHNWIDKYFFNKVSDFILGVILLCIFIMTFFIRKKNINQKNLSYSFYYLTIVILFLEWFFYHPALRYGGYAIIALLFILPISSFITKFQSANKIVLKVSMIIFISFLIFSLRNVSRLNKEMSVYSYKPLIEPYYYLDQSHFRVQKEIINLVNEYNNCNLSSISCNDLNGSRKMIYKFGKYIITNK